MTLYTQNFDGIANGTLISTLAGWQNDIGTQVSATNAESFSPPNSITNTTASSDAVCYNGAGAMGNQILRCVFQVNLGTTSHARFRGRSDGTSQNAYEVRNSYTSGAITFQKTLAGVNQAAIVMTGSSATVPVPNQSYYGKLSITGSGPVLLQYKQWLVGTPEPAAYEAVYSDVTAVFATGYPGLRPEGTAATGREVFMDNFALTDTFFPLAAGTISFGVETNTSIVVNVSSAMDGTPPYVSYQFQRAPDVAGSPGAFANIGAAGTSLTITDTTVALGTKYWYQCIVTDSAAATSTSAPVAVIITPTALTIGTPMLTSISNQTVNITAPAPGGGSGAYTYQWFQSTDPTALGAPIAGATALALSATGIANDLPYYFVLEVNDGTNTIQSLQIPGVAQPVVYVGIMSDSWGNTITPAVGPSVSPSADAIGNILGPRLASLLNDGTEVVVANGAVGGTNGSQWQPGGANFNAALALMIADNANPGAWIVGIALGINDSSVTQSNPAGGESPAQYKAYILAMVTYLLNTWGAAGVVLIGPPCIRAMSANHVVGGVKLLSEYFPTLQAIAAQFPGKCFATESQFNLVANNQPLLGSDFVHPTPPDTTGYGGAVVFSGAWAKAFYDAIRPSTGNGTPWYHA